MPAVGTLYPGAFYPNSFTPEFYRSQDLPVDNEGSPTPSLQPEPHHTTTGFSNNNPLDEAKSPRGGARRYRTYLDDYYNRVHVNPSKIDVGNLLSTQVRLVEVWSAYLEPKLLSSIQEDGTDGVTLTTSEEEPPTYFAALESRIFTLTISTDGAPVMDAKYTFMFDGESPSLEIIGRRVVVWPFMPQVKHKESLEWLTDIIPAFGREQRIAVRAAPRQTFSYDFQLDPYQFSRAKAIASQWAQRVYGVPVWSELTRVGTVASGATEILFDTSYADYRAADIMLVWSSDTDYVAVETLTVLADRVTLKLPMEKTYTNTYVAPIRFSRTNQGMQFKRSNNNIVEASGSFLVTANADLAASVGYPQYRGKDVLTDRAVVTGDISERIYRPLDIIDPSQGTFSVDVKQAWLATTHRLTFDLTDRQSRWNARKWLHSRKGKQKSFWIPTWNADLVMLQDVNASELNFVVRPVGYPLYYSTTDIMIQMVDGSRVFRRVVGGITDSNGNEVLTVDSAFTSAIARTAVEFICFMHHVRLDTDRIDIQHGYAGRATISAQLTGVPE